MKINVNNKPVETEATNIQSLAVQLSLPEKGVAMALNMKMVRQADWEATPIAENDNIIIIKAACGG